MARRIRELSESAIKDLSLMKKLTLGSHVESRIPKGPKNEGGGGCTPQNAVLHITVIGKPTGGTFTIAMTIGTTTETVTFNWNDSASAVKTAIAGHSLIASTDLDTSAGPFPNATMAIEFIDTLANTDIKIPPANWTSLTGGSGVAVITHLAQRGHAG